MLNYKNIDFNVRSGQSGGSFGRCVRCDFVVSMVLHEFEYSPSPLKTDVSCQKNGEKERKHDFLVNLRIFVKAITL